MQTSSRLLFKDYTSSVQLSTDIMVEIREIGLFVRSVYDVYQLVLLYPRYSIRYIDSDMFYSCLLHCVSGNITLMELVVSLHQ